MDTPQIITLFVLAVLMFWAVGAYNRLVGLRNTIGGAWAQIEVQLRRREDLLPSIVAALRAPFAGDSNVLDAVLAASDQASAAASAVHPRPGEAGAVASLALAEQVLAGSVARLHALLDRYPAQAGDGQLAAGLRELAAIEQRLDFARQLFDAAAHGYNLAVHQFPTRLLAPLFRFGPAGRLSI